jgi:Nuclease-related domain
VKAFSLRQEIDRITEAQQLPVFLIMVAFWIVCAVEWTQRFLGAIPDPRFWSLIALVFTIYGGLQIFRLNRHRNRSGSVDPRSKAFHALRHLCAAGWGLCYDSNEASSAIDNVLVGDTGVYAVQVKHRSGSGMIEQSGEGELLFGGRVRDGRLLTNARRAALPLQEYLDAHFENPPQVKAVVVVVGDWSIQPSEADASVDVITVDEVVEYFQRKASTLTKDQVGKISDYLGSLAA